MLYWSICITGIKYKIKNKSKINSQLDYQVKLIPEWNELKSLFMFIYFSGVKLVNLMFFATHLAPNNIIGPTIASGVTFNLNITFKQFVSLCAQPR